MGESQPKSRRKTAKTPKKSAQAGNREAEEESSNKAMLRNGIRVSATQLGEETDAFELAETGTAPATRRLSFNSLSPKMNGHSDDNDKDVSKRSITPTANQPEARLSPKDRRAIILLVVLYLLQGIPVGLAFGSIPYLLRARLSYSQIGIFSLASYPYSLKLLWSPIVDSWYNSKWGRRKSWIVPVQFMVGCMLYWLSRNVASLMEVEEPDVRHLTLLFFVLVFLAATQDIAVDGWALTLLSQDNLSYASTAQTVGLNIGYFLSFTVFLAFNSSEFSNKYMRPASYQSSIPLVTLPGYLRFAATCYLCVTAYLAFVQKEEDEPKREIKAGVSELEASDMGIKKVYQIMFSICRLKHVQSFLLVHLIAKIGTAANDAATSLKLLEKGLSKEDLAMAVLIDFPFQLIFGYLAARWSKGDKPLNPWLAAIWFRLGFAVVAMLLIHFFPTPPISNSYFFLVILCTVLSSFASTVQFVGITAFHTQIADPVIGGTYMTLLNTVSNLGGTWPRYFVLRGVDAFTVATCHVRKEGGEVLVQVSECVSDHGKAICSDLGGECVTDRDGYYIVSSICVLLGVLSVLFFIRPTAKRLHSIPQHSWRVKVD